MIRTKIPQNVYLQGLQGTPITNAFTELKKKSTSMLGYPPYPALSGVGGEAKAYYCIQDPSQNGQITMDRADY